MINQQELWLIIIGLGVGSFLLRFAFIGFVGDRQMPEWLLRYLRYTSVAILPGLVAPLVVWPDATGGQLDAARIVAAAVALWLGVWKKNLLLSVLGGATALYCCFLLF